MTLAFLADSLNEDMRAVDTVIRTRLDSHVVLIRQIADYIIQGGGKRLRPALLLLVAKALHYPGDQHVVLAAVLEFIHTATLLHDDVVDESHLRRGRETANALFGNAASVLVGDFLYSRAFQMMVGVQRMPVMQVLADATNAIAEGEVMQLLNIQNAGLTEAEYLAVIRAKTAKLFEAGAQLGAMLADAPAATVQAMGEYGMELGVAFQIIDDVLDYSGDRDTIGKNLGDDLAEGKTTLPLIHAQRLASAEDAALVRQAIEQADRNMLPEVVRVVQSSGALAATRARAEQAVQQALAKLVVLPDTAYRTALADLAHFALARDY